MIGHTHMILCPPVAMKSVTAATLYTTMFGDGPGKQLADITHQFVTFSRLKLKIREVDQAAPSKRLLAHEMSSSSIDAMGQTRQGWKYGCNMRRHVSHLARTNAWHDGLVNL